MSYNRAAIFVFFDRNGKADRYIDFFLCELTQNINKLVVVINGTADDQACEMFQKYSNDIIVRPNEGYDAWAWKAGLEHIGWDHLTEYDEVILANDTMFGPVFPFSEMFDSMSPRSLGFWGITKHAAYTWGDFTKKNPYKYIPEHIQSYFTVFGKTLLSSPELKKYWDNLGEINTWLDAIGLHETYFTKYFFDKGIEYDTYINIPKDARINENLTMYHQLQMMSEQRMPLIKSKLFCEDFLDFTAGEQAIDTLHFVKNNTDYDEDLILEHIIRKFHQYDVFKSLALTHIIPADYELAISKPPKVALLMHIYFADEFEEPLRLASTMTEYADIYITTDTEDKRRLIIKELEKISNSVEVRLINNRGRSESALLVGMADIINQYDYLCFWKEKRSGQTEPISAPVSWAKKINENLLYSKVFVKNVIATFENTPRLGMLAPAPPNHSSLYMVPGAEWTQNFENTKKLAGKLGLNIPMSPDKPPIAPFGGAFWFRSKAMMKLFKFGWKYEDFPEEPLDVDGTLLHAIERIYPFVSQDSGYYPAYVLNSEYARLDYVNLYHYVRSLNSFLFKYKYSGHGYNYALRKIRQSVAASASIPKFCVIFAKYYVKKFLIATGLIGRKRNRR